MYFNVKQDVSTLL